MIAAVPPVAVVTPGGNDVGVWASTIDQAPRIGLAELVTGLGFGPGIAPGSGPTLIVLAAHPDDETLGLGRLISAWARHQGPVEALLGTAGEAAFDHVRTRPPQLAEVRIAEWHRAADAQGIGGRALIGVPDGQVAAHESEVAAALGTTIDELVRQGTPRDRIALAAPWRRDPHPDHRAVGRAAQSIAAGAAIPLISYGVWMTYWADPDSVAADGQELFRLELDDRAEVDFEAACGCFTTQLQPFEPGMTEVVPPAMLAHLGEQRVLVQAR